MRMGFFRHKQPHGSVVLMDIENGSVGVSLAHIRANEAPRLFAQNRIIVPLMDTRSASALVRAVAHAAHESLLQASEARTRMQNHTGTPPVHKVVLFMAAPWGVPNLSEGRPDFSQTLLGAITPTVRALFGDIPIAVHAHASAIVNGMRALHPDERDALIVSVNGEVTELVLLRDARVAGYATAPVGAHTIIRTLKSHAHVTPEEARSALLLATRAAGASALAEALQSAATHVAGECAYAARELCGAQGQGDVFVLGHEPVGEWFARTLTKSALADVFSRGGTVRTIRAVHLNPYVEWSGLPDAHLALSALYAHAAHAR